MSDISPFTAKYLQERLGVTVDGYYGDETEKAIKAILGLNNKLPVMGRPWGRARLVLAYQQLLMQQEGLKVEVDGLMGPETRDAFERWQNMQRGGAEAPVASDKDTSLWARVKEWWWDDSSQPEPPAPMPKTEKQVVPVKPLPVVKKAAKDRLVFNEWPKQRDVEEFFGAKGDNQVRIKLPYTMAIAWEPRVKVNTMVCHEKVGASIQRVLSAALEHYGEEGLKELGLDKYGGCLNVRKVRGGNTWSMHSWGIAIDFDPDRNGFRVDHTKARLARADAKAWWEMWEAEGWLSLGRERDFDWMHVQAARL